VREIIVFETNASWGVKSTLNANQELKTPIVENNGLIPLTLELSVFFCPSVKADGNL